MLAQGTPLPLAAASESSPSEVVSYTAPPANQGKFSGRFSYCSKFLPERAADLLSLSCYFWHFHSRFQATIVQQADFCLEDVFVLYFLFINSQNNVLVPFKKNGNGAYEEYARITAAGTTFQRIILSTERGRVNILLSEASSQKINPLHDLGLESMK